MAQEDASAPSSAAPEERLERGALLFYERCPFPLPAGDDLSFLLGQRLGRFAHKNISFDPATGRVAGHSRLSPSHRDRLRRVLAGFSQSVTVWLAQTFPRYQADCAPDRASFRSEEEATRCLRLSARNDLLHVDAFPNRPSHGRRILRVFANINLTEPRVWMTSEPFARLFERYGARAGLPGLIRGRWLEKVGERVLGVFRPGRPPVSEYDAFMLRFHGFLKREETFQEKASRRLWSFPPGSAWVAMTDACSHAVLRGRYALEHSYFVGTEALAVPEEAPVAYLARACGRPVRQAG
jgi:hypothetical protein